MFANISNDRFINLRYVSMITVCEEENKIIYQTPYGDTYVKEFSKPGELQKEINKILQEE